MEASLKTQVLHHQAPEISERIRDLQPYDPVSSLTKIKQNKDITHFKLDWNETTIPPSPKVIASLTQYLGNGSKLNWYPEMFYTPLFEKLSKYVGCRLNQVLLTNGSDDALDLICQTYLDPNQQVVSPVPTYNHFLQFAKRTGARVKEVSKDNPFGISLEEIADHIDSETKIVYLANPNNPTGNVYSPGAILSLIKSHPGVVFVSDEAYFEFAGISCSKLIDEAENIIITRSFSKCFGLAGLRIGYLIARETVIHNLRRVFNPKSVNMLAQIAAIAALDDLPYYNKYVREVKRSAAMVKDFFDRRGIVCRPTFGNFILVKLDNPTEIAQKLAKVGIHVRDRSKHLPGYIRFGLDTEERTTEILSRIEKVLDEKKSTSFISQ